ncbi:MAG: transcriptional repressor LexA [Turicibacter sp.]|nr:transcriptional repressor LexA [Turicibacter sp.]
MKKPISKRQQEILDFIGNQVSMRGYPPSVREIGAAVGLSSTASVHNQLNQLEKKGFIRKDKSTTRGLVVLSHGSTSAKSMPATKDARLVEVPLLGKVTAGTPIEAIKNPSEFFTLPSHLVPAKENVFVLNVKGDSMINAGILDGDHIIVKESRTARNGEIIVAMLKEDSEVTVKRYYKEQGHIRLQPENDAMDPILSTDVEVVGKVIGLYRSIA